MKLSRKPAKPSGLRIISQQIDPHHKMQNMTKVRIARLEDKSRWDDYVRRHPSGLAYHQFAWGQAVRDAYRFEPCYLLSEDDGQVTGALPMINFKIPLLGLSLVSLPYCDVGGCLADNDETQLALYERACEMGQVTQAKKIELRQVAKGGECPPGAKVRMVLDLPESSEALLAGFKSKLRSQVKKPMRDGLQFELGAGNLVADFYQVFRENMRDLGSPVHSRKWFDSIVQHFGEGVRVGVVRTPGGQLAAAGVVLLAGDTVSIPWASSLVMFNRLNPNMLLYWGFLSFAADSGFLKFDFGRSTLGEGTFNFKKQWGAKPVPLAWGDLLSPSVLTEGGGGSGKMRRIVENFWKKMPITVATALGPKLRRYVSL